MTQGSPFHPQSQVTRTQLLSSDKPELHKLKPGVKQRIIIPNASVMRVLMPIHFGRGMAASRTCRCSMSCLDCKDNLPLSFHLYVGCYRGPRSERSIIALGTAIPKVWERQLPSFDHQFDVWRDTATSPIKLMACVGVTYDQSAFPAWDVYPDVAAMFKGRMSAAAVTPQTVKADEEAEYDEKYRIDTL